MLQRQALAASAVTARARHDAEEYQENLLSTAVRSLIDLSNSVRYLAEVQCAAAAQSRTRAGSSADIPVLPDRVGPKSFPAELERDDSDDD